ncbi:MAG: hypothetical protein KF790_03795 [Steroidobacteraceae bacterium]|nr:hypothetical protein [Steroidobacteraceae bacterium]
MSDAAPKVVVRSYAPSPRRWLLAALVLLGIFALYVVYEYGRFDGGYDRLTVSQRNAEHEVEVGRLEKQNRELRARLAEFESAEVGHSQERAEVAKTIGDLQAQVAKQAQELAFYEGIVVQGGATPEVKIQQLRIAATDDPQTFRLRITLVQPVRPDRNVTGTVTARVEGEREGGQLTLELATLTGGKLSEIPYSFRYFENIDPEITLPEGFSPARVQVEVRSNRKGIAPVNQTLAWSLE